MSQNQGANNNQNVQMNNNMMFNMNYLDMQNEILKSVIEGMGEQPTDDIVTNWNRIMNFVPSLNSTNSYNINNNLSKGKLITLKFSSSKGTKIELKIGEDTELKVALQEYLRISGKTVKRFLCLGKQLNINDLGTIKENGLKNQTIIVYENE